MARYSVYDPDRHVYVYYDGPGPGGTHAGSPRARARSELGATPEGAAWKLPASAVRVGEGERPQGRIAVVSPGLALGDLTDPLTLGVAGVIAYLAWRAIR